MRAAMACCLPRQKKEGTSTFDSADPRGLPPGPVAQNQPRRASNSRASQSDDILKGVLARYEQEEKMKAQDKPLEEVHLQKVLIL